MKIFVFLIAALAMFVGGGQALYGYLTNLTPTTMDYAVYEKTPSNKKWLKLRGCELDLTEASYFNSSGGEAEEIFVPIRSVGSAKDAPIMALVVLDDETEVGLYNRLLKVHEEAAALKLMAEHRQTFFQTRDIEGTVRFGVIGVDDKKVAALRRNIPTLHRGFAIIDQGKRPVWFKGALAILAGFVALFIAVRPAKSPGAPPA